MFHQALAVNVEQQVIVSQMARGDGQQHPETRKTLALHQLCFLFAKKNDGTSPSIFTLRGLGYSDISLAFFPAFYPASFLTFLFWHSLWHSIYLPFFSGILSGIYSDFLFYHSIWHSFCLYLAFSLAWALPDLNHCPLRSGARH